MTRRSTADNRPLPVTHPAACASSTPKAPRSAPPQYASWATIPAPPQARQLGGSAYWRLSAGDWRILYEPEGETVTVLALKVGRVS
ncbi:hypothetical protein TPA0910_67670 [Streptomyces hygroscopicus subsp. sporocinereus]|uniref:Type II toxin-antitoxin system RelE/ParE family toxin n=1 Tax=Streptomyces hygroscopicus TaxID=1912 RepID=A0ABQ3U9Q0_STRHY|nr:hypothetical protein [Streptomyces hygroscopicus]GHJ32334.1 hypothetical protein TPA0910_67670 [Streptomyces hygroscopicus]